MSPLEMPAGIQAGDFWIIEAFLLVAASGLMAIAFWPWRKS